MHGCIFVGGWSQTMISCIPTDGRSSTKYKCEVAEITNLLPGWIDYASNIKKKKKLYGNKYNGIALSIVV